MTAAIAVKMAGADLLKLRRKRGTVAWAFVISSGLTLAFFAYNAIAHSSDPIGHAPAGGLGHFKDAMTFIGASIGVLSAVLIGAEAGAGDESSGVFRDLVATGRSRTALFLTRIPAAVALNMAVVLVSSAIATVATFVFAGGGATPDLGLVLQWTAWALVASSAVTVVTVGFGAITGNKVVTTTAMIGWVAVISQLLMYSKGLGSVREVLLGSALLNLAPGAFDGPAVVMSTGLAVVVTAVWLAVFTVAGAWRTRTRDA